MKFLILSISLLLLPVIQTSAQEYEECSFEFECGYPDPVIDSNADNWQGFTDEELRGLGALPLEGDSDTAIVPPTPSTECLAFECDDSGFPSSAGEIVASDDGTTEAIVDAGATDYLKIPKKCDACDADAAYLALDTTDSRGPASECEYKDEDNNCIEYSEEDSGRGAK